MIRKDTCLGAYSCNMRICINRLHRNLHYTHVMEGNVDREDLKLNGPGMQKLERKTFLVMGMAIYSDPLPALKRSPFTAWVFNKGDFNFCICSSPLAGLTESSSPVS